MGIYESMKENYEADRDSTVRRNIQDIVRSYRYFWDPFSELIQNSVDSINRRYRMTKDIDCGYKGRILIEVWPDKKRLKVSDNGTGIKPDQICKLLCPDSSDKKRGVEYGYKGKGLTFAAFITKKFDILTKYFETSVGYEYAVDGLFLWMIKSEEDSFPNKPMSDPVQADDSKFKQFNTAVTLTLEDEYSSKFGAPNLDSVFSMFMHDKHLIDCFSILLRTKTAIGNTKVLFGKAPIVPIDVVLKVYKDDYIYEEPVKYEFYQPKESELLESQSFEFSKYVSGLDKSGPRKFVSLYFNKNNMLVGQRSQIKMDAYVVMITATQLDRLNDFLGFGNYDVDDPLSYAKFKSGIFLAIDGMATGIKIDNWSERGAALKKYFIIVDCDLNISDELDAGRKGISENRGKQISDEIYRLIKEEKPVSPIDNKTHDDYGLEFYRYGRNIILGNTYKQPEDDDFSNRLNAAKEQEENDKKNINEIFNFIYDNTSFIHVPMFEEETRALFHELMILGVIKGYKTVYAAASRADYDMALYYELKQDRKDDPNGIPPVVWYNIKKSKITLKDAYTNMKLKRDDALCVEFKLTATQLIDELDSRPDSVKAAQDIDLLIVWDTDEKGLEKYKECQLSSVNPDKKYLHSVTNKLQISLPSVSSDIYVISLKKVIENLLPFKK